MVIQFAGLDIQVERWDGTKDPPMAARMLGLDTETKLIVLGEPYLPATLQVYWPEHKLVMYAVGDQIRPFLDQVLILNPDAELVFHHYAFDHEVLGGRDNPLLMNRVVSGKITDTGLRYLMKLIHDGNWVGEGTQRWSLDYVAEQLLGIEVEKDDEIRLTFHPDMELTERHVKYMCIDPVVAVMCRDRMIQRYKTEQTQLIGSIALHRISYDGFKVDKDRFLELRKQFQEEASAEAKILQLFGIHPGVPGVSLIEQELLANIEKRCGKKFPRSPKTKKICTGSAIRAMFSPEERKHPYIEADIKMDHAQKLVSNYFKEEFIGTTGRIHCRFSYLKRTGRTACGKPNLCFLNRG